VREASGLSAEPLLSVKVDAETGQAHVVRAILTCAWEPSQGDGNIIEGSERVKWVRELVGTLDLEACTDNHELHSELRQLLHAAVRGASRLPLHSVEAPLPAYSLGQLAYVERPSDGPADRPLRTWQDLLEVAPVPLESVLRSVAPAEAALVAQHLVARSSAAAVGRDLQQRLRSLFNDVSLSPYTQFIDTTAAFIEALVEIGVWTSADEADFWSWLLRQLGRHLTAYDLITFHYRGANYPDALVLDVALKRLLRLIERHPELFHGSPADGKKQILRRRALRQACLVRRYYEGHPVPDAPTSPGENARVLPPPHVRVPEEQILNTRRRRKYLYADEPLASLLTNTALSILGESVVDLADAPEWSELGMAVFIDRPLGWGKAVGEPDLTPLVAHEAFSPSIARRRFEEFQRLIQELGIDGVRSSLPPPGDIEAPGLAAAEVAEPDRTTVSLADARRVADDFVILRTLPQSLKSFIAAINSVPLQGSGPIWQACEKFLVARVPDPDHGTVLAWFDSALRKRVEMVSDLSKGFVTRRGYEMPAAGVHINTARWASDYRC
jgi:hypothetical protein